MRIATFVTAALFGAVTPVATLAQGGGWKWTSSPQESPNGGHCWMGIGHQGRKISVHATSGSGNFMGLDSPALGAMAAQENGTITFAGGTPAHKQFTVVWQKGSTKPTTYIASGIDGDGVVAVLQGFIFAETMSEGMSVAVGSSGDLHFPVTGARQAAEGFAGCMDKL